MENGLACLATELIAPRAGEEIAEKQARDPANSVTFALARRSGENAKTLINVLVRAVFTALPRELQTLFQSGITSKTRSSAAGFSPTQFAAT